MRRSKLYAAQQATFNSQERYEVQAALELLKAMPHVKFDETVEMHLKLGVDPRKSDQNVRGAVPLPAGTGKLVRVAVVADGAQADEAREAGAEFVGYEDIVQQIKEGWQDFDILIAIFIIGGLSGLLISVTAASVIGCLIYLPAIVLKKRDKKDPLPFIPLLLMGTMCFLVI